jgi:hypothetical protein
MYLYMFPHIAQDAPRGLQDASKSGQGSKKQGKPIIFQRAASQLVVLRGPGREREWGGERGRERRESGGE